VPRRPADSGRSISAHSLPDRSSFRSTPTTSRPAPTTSSCFSLAGDADEIRFGLPDAYRRAVLTGLRFPIELVVAAHGRTGSSAYVFRRVAALLSELLAKGVPETDDDLWSLWDQTSSR
jgi:hypothetical protein